MRPAGARGNLRGQNSMNVRTSALTPHHVHIHIHKHRDADDRVYLDALLHDVEQPEKPFGRRGRRRAPGLLARWRRALPARFRAD
jgi:hypothetical protein